MDTQRFERKSRADQAGFETSLAELARVPMGDDAREVLSFASSGNALIAACRMVADAAGIALREPPVTTGDRTDALEEIARASGFRMRSVALSDGWWHRDNGPLLAFVAETGQPVALIPISPRSYVLRDPVARTRVAVDRENSGALDPNVFSFCRPFAERALTGWDLACFAARGCRPDLITIAAMGVVCALLALMMPVAAGIVLETVIPGAERVQLLQLTIGLVLCSLASAACNVTRSIAVVRLETRVGTALQTGVWDRLLNLPAGFFRQYSSGDLALRSMGIEGIRRRLTGSCSRECSREFSLFSAPCCCSFIAWSWRLSRSPWSRYRYSHRARSGTWR